MQGRGDLAADPLPSFVGRQRRRLGVGRAGLSVLGSGSRRQRNAYTVTNNGTRRPETKGDLDYETTDLNRIRQAEQHYGGRGTSYAITSPLFAVCLPF